MLVKVRRMEIEVNKNDLVLFNGACYQIITKSHAILAKSRARKMIKEGKLVFEKVRDGGLKCNLIYYRFNV